MLWLLVSGQVAIGETPDSARVGVHDLESLTTRLELTVGPVRWVAPPSPDAVVNGEVVPDGNDQVVALAGRDPSTGSMLVFCSGSLIHESWVLTAAHCIDGSRDIQGYGLDLNILWGSDVNFSWTDAIPWAMGIADPSYSSGQFTNDAGLVELSTPKKDVQWMVLNDSPVDASWVGTELTFFGYGVTGDGGSGEGTQRTTRIPIQDVDAFNITTFSADTNVCSGDSGGPSIFEGPDGPEQVGVNAFVTPGCVGGQAGSTRVDNHIEWIRSYVPDVATDYADLPVEDVPGGGSDGRHWLEDLGVADELGGLSPLPEGDGSSASGCQIAGSTSAMATGLGWLARRRP